MKTLLPFGLVVIVGLVLVGVSSRSAATDKAEVEQARSDAPDVEQLRLRIDALEKRVAEVERVRPAEDQVAGQIRFGAVVTNLKAERATRYLRIGLVVVVAEGQEKAVRERLTHQKAALTSWLLEYAADQTLETLSGTKNLERIRGDVRAAFDKKLSAAGSPGAVKEVLLTEYIVQ